LIKRSLAVAEKRALLRVVEYYANSLKSLKVIKMISFKSLGTLSYSHAIVTMALFGIISEMKRYIGRKCFYTPLHSTPVRRSSSEYCHNFWY